MRCIGCPGDAERGHTRCRPCLTKCAAFCADRVRRGKCRQCGEPRERADRTLCNECGRIACAKVRDRRAARVKAGLCIAFGCKRKPLARRRFCATHRDAQNTYHRECLERKAGRAVPWSKWLRRLGFLVFLSPGGASIRFAATNSTYTSPTIRPPAVKPRAAELVKLADAVIAEHEANVRAAWASPVPK